MHFTPIPLKYQIFFFQSFPHNEREKEIFRFLRSGLAFWTLPLLLLLFACSGDACEKWNPLSGLARSAGTKLEINGLIKRDFGQLSGLSRVFFSLSLLAQFPLFRNPEESVPAQNPVKPT